MFMAKSVVTHINLCGIFFIHSIRLDSLASKVGYTCEPSGSIPEFGVLPLMLSQGPALPKSTSLTVWAAEIQWDSKDRCRSVNNQVTLTAGVQQIHTYIVTTINIHQQCHFKYHSQRQREAFSDIRRYIHSVLLINFTDTEYCTYRLAVHIRHSSQSTHIQSQTGNHSLQ